MKFVETKPKRTFPADAVQLFFRSADDFPTVFSYRSFVCPVQIKPIEHTTSIPVNLDCMKIDGDGGTVNIKLNRFRLFLTSKTFESFSYVMITALDRRYKSSVVSRWEKEAHLFFRLCCEALGATKIETITLGMYLWYTEACNPSQVGLIRTFLSFWCKQNVEGLHRGLARHLDSASPPKRPSTQQIQNQKPDERPLTIAQSRQISERIGELYAAKEFSSQDQLLWTLISAEGLRPSQLALLRVKHFEIIQDEHGEILEVLIHVPAVKQKGTPALSYLITETLASRAWVPLTEHLNFVSTVAGRELMPEDRIFCLTKDFLGNYVISKSPLRINLIVNETRARIIAGIPDLENVILFCRRFKHTMLTHLGLLGAPLSVLQRCAYQTSSGSVRRYVNVSKDVQRSFETEMANSHNALVRFFKGRIVDRAGATHPDEEHLIGAPGLSDEDLGACAVQPCKGLMNVGCYGCYKFEAFADGPHQEALDHLESLRLDRAALHLDDAVVTRDDHLIEAVKQVIADIGGQHLGQVQI
ncbi:MAG: hypothetical protein EOP76_01515 [Variovorax sp.]|nr:MAG: hypothetical protein EOP76_01515 [Variovorax sp.]